MCTRSSAIEGVSSDRMSGWIVEVSIELAELCVPRDD